MTKKRPLPPERKAECDAAHELFLSKKKELGLSQKKIADLAEMTPAAVNLYFKGINALNVQFASVLASAINEPIERFSPRLAREAEMINKAINLKSNVISARAAVDTASSLLSQATPRTHKLLQEIISSAEQGKLTESDALLLHEMYKRIVKE